MVSNSQSPAVAVEVVGDWDLWQWLCTWAVNYLIHGDVNTAIDRVKWDLVLQCFQNDVIKLHFGKNNIEDAPLLWELSCII